MQQRVSNPKGGARYDYYGGRGIKCEWHTFIDFKNDMYESYLKHCVKFGESNTTLERVDNNANYSGSNCRWATRKEQHYNTKNVLKFMYMGETLTLRQWSDRLGISISTLRDRHYVRKWSGEKLFQPPTK